MPNEAPQPQAQAKLSSDQSSLLPPMLTGASAYLWLWVLPIALLIALNLQGYWLIEGNMEAAERASAHWLGLSNLLNLMTGVALYFIVKTFCRNNSTSTWKALPAIAIQIAYLWHATATANEILPASVTTWIYPESRYFYHQYAFCMLPLFWGILQIACSNVRFLSKSITKNVLIAIGAPLTLFLALQVLRLFDSLLWSSTIGPTLLVSMVVALSVLMFVAVIRGLMLILKNLNRWKPRTHVIAVIIIALVMPISGLLLNRSIPFPVDFQAWEIYALVVVNTIILIVATLIGARMPRLSFGLICSSFPFTLYFFVVFLPYTPLSILGCIAMGAGFLVLTPTFLFTLHTYQFNRTRKLAAEQGTGCERILIGLLAFLLLPGFFTVRALLDKAALNGALAFVYTPAIDVERIEYPGNRTQLKRALASHRNYKNGIYYPLLSDYYSWLVFDNLVLPDDKIEKLEMTFFGVVGSNTNNDPFISSNDFFGSRNVRDRHRMPRAAPPSREVTILKQSLELNAVDANSTLATLTLELENTGPEGTWGGAEYINQLQVPPGVLINGFRLHINGVPVLGRIFEKKTALWVYTMIRDSERRDPGLLVYNNPSEIELRVFPINRDQAATVEIDFLIPNDLSSIQKPSTLPNPAKLIPALYPQVAQLAEGRDYSYLTPLATDALPQIKRDQYIHAIIDRSQNNGFAGERDEAITLIQENFPEHSIRQFTLANFNLVNADDDKLTFDALPAAGGFDLDKTLAHLIARYTQDSLDNFQELLPAEPIFVILNRAGLGELPPLDKTMIWASNLSGLNIFSIARSGELEALKTSASTAPVIKLGKRIRPAIAGRSLIFPASQASPQYYAADSPEIWQALAYERHSADEAWAQAIELWVENHRYAASPGTANKSLKELVASSRSTGTLIPATSYIVVENEAQWRMLKKKEGQKLEQNEALDFLETPAPPALVILIGLGGWFIWRKRRPFQSFLKE